MNAQRTGWRRRQHRTFVTDIPADQVRTAARSWIVGGPTAVVAQTFGTVKVAQGKVTGRGFQARLGAPGWLGFLFPRLVRVFGRFRPDEAGTYIDAVIAPSVGGVLGSALFGFVVVMLVLGPASAALIVLGMEDAHNAVAPVVWPLGAVVGILAAVVLHLRQLRSSLARDDAGRLIASAFAAREVTNPNP